MGNAFKFKKRKNAEKKKMELFHHMNDKLTDIHLNQKFLIERLNMLDQTIAKTIESTNNQIWNLNLRIEENETHFEKSIQQGVQTFIKHNSSSHEIVNVVSDKMQELGDKMRYISAHMCTRVSEDINKLDIKMNCIQDLITQTVSRGDVGMISEKIMERVDCKLNRLEQPTEITLHT